MVLTPEQPVATPKTYIPLNESLVNIEANTVWSMAEAAFIQCPTEKRDLRKALVDLYLAQSAISFLFLGSFDIDHFFEKVDAKLWRDIFTREQTSALVEAQRNKLLRDIGKGTSLSWDVWRCTGHDFSALLSTSARLTWLSKELGPQNLDSDASLTRILPIFKEVVPLELMLDVSQLRAQCVIAAIGLADAYFQTEMLESENRILQQEREQAALQERAAEAAEMPSIRRDVE